MKRIQSAFLSTSISLILVLFASCGATKKVTENNSAYLFVYFTGNAKTEEAIRFGLSKDGYNYYALNDNKPVIASETISTTGGVRDPHILRAADGKTFYMTVTDLQTANGWDNQAMVLLKSTDLVNWTSSKVDISKVFDGFKDVTRVWAPQTIYDAKAKKYMVYFSMLQPGGKDIVYYSYANADFTALETVPKQLFFSPTNGSCIDADIIEKDGKFHLFLKTEDTADKGIKLAISDKLTSGYVLKDEYVDQTNESVEGSGVFKLNNSDTYILMYDMYRKGKYQFTSSTDLENFKVIDESVSMNFHPRHGTVLPITKSEAQRLIDKFGWFPNSEILGVQSAVIKQNNVIVDVQNKKMFLPVKNGTDLKNFDPEFKLSQGARVSPAGAQDFSKQAVKYDFEMTDLGKMTFDVEVAVRNNPSLTGYYADPEILYSNKDNRFHLYPTSDGFHEWSGDYFKSFSSTNLVDWVDDGVLLDLKKDVSWTDVKAWAPAAAEKKINGKYQYFFYYTGDTKIGVAVSDNPQGPFTDIGKPLVGTKPNGITRGQVIDPDVFTDPVSGKSYLYWGNGFMVGAELNDDMISLKEKTLTVLKPDGTFREGTEVFYRKGKYYFMWSQDDTRSENYRVRYATSTSPLGNFTIPKDNLVLAKDPSQGIYGTGHNCVIQIPGTDEWYIIYHRFTLPKGIAMGRSAGYNREVCIDRLYFDEEGNIIPVKPTLEGIQPVKK
ncbi:family 43 glycosylhydrolase [Flavobacterium seoulense]|uniref:Beta-xylosidase n=1 Tax=Flavobacterium seoulense TaxID=1492738 RepID=A0A066WWM0_9FLAO|nr:family 43 glycosylhydrolase [Flavobacterium seoulense]KDN55065.1 beta-xylosidase [Flavobacterium seoulense]